MLPTPLQKLIFFPLDTNKGFPIRSAVATPGSLDARFGAIRVKPYANSPCIGQFRQKYIQLK